MRSLVHPPRVTAAPGRRIGVLTAVAVMLLAAFFLVPHALTHEGVHVGNVGRSFRQGMAVYWDSGSRDLPRQLDTTVGFWFRFHLVKAGVSALLLATAVLLGAVLWRSSRQRADRPGRMGIVLPGVLVGLLGPFALVGLVANVQGAAAPFASLLPLLTSGGGDGDVAADLPGIRRQVADFPTGRHSPALTMMVRDFALYHAVLAALATVVALALTGVCVVLWRRHRVTHEVRSRRALKLAVAATASVAGIALVVAVANVTSAAHPAEALAALLDGGW
ncbi:tat (twin-arginine translocation) pathway signal sequence [Streptomyces sp. NPDC085932]|uniref:tat (twin-arginine translocation) pathway signal sequence n=1 Tax=Streptomyces sp. NPDC085932 TaxID=3365741 RepID=UPI0037CDFA6D